MMNPIAYLLYQILNVVWFLIIVQIVISWLVAFNILNTQQQLVRTISGFLYAVTEPIYRPFRNFIPVFNGIDLSPIAVLIGISFLQYLIMYLSV